MLFYIGSHRYDIMHSETSLSELLDEYYVINEWQYVPIRQQTYQEWGKLRVRVRLVTCELEHESIRLVVKWLDDRSISNSFW